MSVCSFDGSRGRGGAKSVAAKRAGKGSAAPRENRLVSEKERFVRANTMTPSREACA